MTEKGGGGVSKPKPRICIKCRKGGTIESRAPDGRPLYFCTRCQQWWTEGRAKRKVGYDT